MQENNHNLHLHVPQQFLPFNFNMHNYQRHCAYYVDWKTSKLNPLMPGAKKKVTHTKTNSQLKAAGLFKYVWNFCHHHALKGWKFYLYKPKTATFFKQLSTKVGNKLSTGKTSDGIRNAILQVVTHPTHVSKDCYPQLVSNPHRSEIWPPKWLDYRCMPPHLALYDIKCVCFDRIILVEAFSYLSNI